MLPYVNIHTHRPTGSGIELRTAGVHPWDAATQDAATLGQRLGGAQAVGETGLDFVRGADRAAQLSALRTQLRLARERGLPVVLHCVRAFEPLMRELAASEPRAVILPRLHRLARAGAAGPGERLLPLVRRTHVRIAQDPCGAARDAAFAALSGDRRQPRAHRGNLRPGGGGERGAGGGAATGNFR